jgi:pyruvate dehydrogenase E1 component alpha subunit
MSEDEIQAIRDRIEAEVEACVQFAEESPFPDNAELLRDIYVEDNYPFLID